VKSYKIEASARGVAQTTVRGGGGGASGGGHSEERPSSGMTNEDYPRHGERVRIVNGTHNQNVYVVEYSDPDHDLVYVVTPQGYTVPFLSSEIQRDPGAAR
jgi:hypothetical protein